MSTAWGYVEDELLEYSTQEEKDRYELYVEKEHYLGDPDQWVIDKLDEYLWSIQSEIASSVVNNRYTAVPSCHDAGKSFTVSRLAAWWLDSHVPGEAFVVSTAPTFAQVRAILWREINMAHTKGGLIGEVNQTEWHIPGIGLVGFGRKPADNNPAAFQGIHADHVLVIVDEACGVAKDIFEAADTLVANEGSRMIAIGNPDDPQSHFATICTPGSGWNVIPIDGYNTPNLSGEWVPENVRPKLLHPIWVQERKERWGENSPIFLSKVRGQFPEDATDGVVRWTTVAKAQYIEPDEPEQALPVELGMDVGASMDGDATVIRERRGNTPGREWTAHSDESEELADLAVAAIIETGATAIKVDVIGVGFGVAGHIRAELKRLKIKCRVQPVNVSEASDDKKRFKNLRSQIWWEVGREAIDDGLYALGELDDDTKAELLAPKYSENATGQIVVEPKDETRKRLDASPDHADAFLLAFYKSRRTGPGKSTGKQIAAARIG